MRSQDKRFAGEKPGNELTGSRANPVRYTLVSPLVRSLRNSVDNNKNFSTAGRVIVWTANVLLAARRRAKRLNYQSTAGKNFPRCNFGTAASRVDIYHLAARGCDGGGRKRNPFDTPPPLPTRKHSLTGSARGIACVREIARYSHENERHVAMAGPRGAGRGLLKKPSATRQPRY